MRIQKQNWNSLSSRTRSLPNSTSLSFLRTNLKRNDPPIQMCNLIIFWLKKKYIFILLQILKRFDLLKDKALNESTKSIDLISKIAGNLVRKFNFKFFVFINFMV